MKRSSAFTLVELLIVIGIITILAALLLPALRKAVYTARTVACGSNFKQVGTGYMGYTSENRRWYPYAPRQHDASCQYCAPNTMAGTTRGIGSVPGPRTLGHGGHWNLGPLVASYYGDNQSCRSVFTCPHMEGLFPYPSNLDISSFAFPMQSNSMSNYGMFPNVYRANVVGSGGKKSTIMRKMGQRWLGSNKYRMNVLGGEIMGSGFGRVWSNHGSVSDYGEPFSNGSLVLCVRSHRTIDMNGHFLLDDGSVHLRRSILVDEWITSKTNVPAEFGR